MTAKSEPSIEPIDRRWYKKHVPGLSYSERSQAFRESLPNAQEFIVLLEAEAFVPIRHLIAKAIKENDEQESVYAGIEGTDVRAIGTITDAQHTKFDDQDGSIFASTIDHIIEKVVVPPNIDLDPFILFHLARTKKPTIVGYDTSKLEQVAEARWVPRPNETLLSAVSGIYHLSPKKSS